MGNDLQPSSVILVLESAKRSNDGIKAFCDRSRLAPLQVSPGHLMEVLRSDMDLGGILCGEDYAGTLAETTALALRIHEERPELPIFLRRDQRCGLDDIPKAQRYVFCAAWVESNVESLDAVLGEYLVSLVYPGALVRGISEISRVALASQLPGLAMECRAPCIVRDGLIFGELFSLIPLESRWCRGYMMLQADESPLLDLIARRNGKGEASFREVASLLSETTNLIWGAFKNRFIGDAGAGPGQHIQVPLLINHHLKYISFGTENPQLCFLYTLRDTVSGASMKLYQRFIFNLNWSPEGFRELAHEVDDPVARGELELFDIYEGN